MFLTPAVAGERVFVGSCGGAFYAVNAHTGGVVWSHDTGLDGALGQFHGDALVTDDLVVVGSHSRRRGFLYAFDQTSGAVRWQIPFEGGVEGQVHRYGETALTVAASGEVVAVDLASGTLRWRLQLPKVERAGWDGDPVLVSGRLVVPWRSGPVDAVHAATGEHLWRYDSGSPLDTSAAQFEGEVLVGTRNGRLLRLHPETGKLRGDFDHGVPGGALYGDLLPAGSCLLALQAAAATEEWPTLAGPFSVACLRPASREVLWEHVSEAVISTERPLVRNGTVVVGSQGLLWALDLRDGGVLWQHPIAGTPRGLGASADTLYVGTREGKLLALAWPGPD